MRVVGSHDDKRIVQVDLANGLFNGLFQAEGLLQGAIGVSHVVSLVNIPVLHHEKEALVTLQEQAEYYLRNPKA